MASNALYSWPEVDQDLAYEAASVVRTCQVKVLIDDNVFTVRKNTSPVWSVISYVTGKSVITVIFVTLYFNRITSDRFFFNKWTIDKLSFAVQIIGNQIKIFWQFFDYRVRFFSPSSVCLFFHLPVCLPAHGNCLLACQPACLATSLPACLPACLSCLYACLSVWLCLSASLPACLSVWSNRTNGSRQTPFVCHNW